jgi:hypothetical protein
LIFDFAGLLRIDPQNFSFRQLYQMYLSCQKNTWDHTAAICSTILNVNRGSKSKIVKMENLNPYRKSKKEFPKIQLDKKASMRILKKVFIDHDPPTLEDLQSGKI